MPRTATVLSARIDLSTCDQEPIHTPASIQPFGALLVLDEPGRTVLQASANVDEFFGKRVDAILGRPISDLVDPATARSLRAWLDGPTLHGNARYLGTIELEAKGRTVSLNTVAHRADDAIVLEFERASHDGAISFRYLDLLVRTFLTQMESAVTADELCRFAVQEVRAITRFDRALIYRFDDDGAGTVVAEDRSDALPSYLGHRFPASDIPAQARELYRLNRVRLIPDSEYRPVPLVPAIDPRTDQPLDMTYSTLRSVSPVHVEYLKNMKTAASLSISILRDGRLWGLISCHHATARHVPLEVRTACDILGQILSLQLVAKERDSELHHRIGLTSVEAKLLASMANEERFVGGLVSVPNDLLAFAAAGGAAVIDRGHCTRVGVTPAEPDVWRIVDWLSDRVRQEVFSTASLADVMPGAESFKDEASGLLAIAVSKLHRSYILWFRPEVVQTIAWGGDPRKPLADDGEGGRIHPRRSFEVWKETVRLHSLPWRPSEIETAAELRNAIVGIMLRTAEELAELNAELKRSNKELEAFSYSVSHDLRAPFRHIVGYSELLLNEADLSERGRRYANTIIESALYAGVLVDNLLAFSQIARTSITPVTLDMNQLVAEVRNDVMSEADGRRITWRVAELPPVRCDPVMMRLAVRNILSNAVKYTRMRDEALIEVGTEVHPSEIVYYIRDNGAGFDMQYVDKLFGVFQRLHRMEEFEGTGIGLANVRRIIERHGGRTWAEGAVDQGATIYFSLPTPPGPGEH